MSTYCTMVVCFTFDLKIQYSLEIEQRWTYRSMERVNQRGNTLQLLTNKNLIIHCYAPPFITLVFAFNKDITNNRLFH